MNVEIHGFGEFIIGQLDFLRQVGTAGKKQEKKANQTQYSSSHQEINRPFKLLEIQVFTDMRCPDYSDETIKTEEFLSFILW